MQGRGTLYGRKGGMPVCGSATTRRGRRDRFSESSEGDVMCVNVLDRRFATVASFEERPAVPRVKEEVQMVDEESRISRMAENGERRYNKAIMDLGCTATVARQTHMGGRVHPGHRCRDPEVQHRASRLRRVHRRGDQVLRGSHPAHHNPGRGTPKFWSTLSMPTPHCCCPGQVWLRSS